MSRFGLVPVRLLALVVVVAAIVAPGPASAATAQDFLNAPVWYVSYEVTFTSNYDGNIQSMHGPMTFTSSLVRVLTGSDKLNLRSQGPGAIGMGELTAGMGKNPSAADAQKMTMNMMAMMDNRANWMAGGASIDDENASDAEISASGMPMGTVSIDYTRVDIGKDLVDETGSKYDSKTTTTMKGTGAVQVGGLGATNFELSTSDNSFSVMLPFTFNAQSEGTKMVTVTVVSWKGTPGEETTSENDMRFDLYPAGIALDAPPKGSAQGGVLIRGTFDPATGKIAGEQSFPAHYKDGGNDAAPGTLTFKYTLTTTPPPAKK